MQLRLQLRRPLPANNSTRQQLNNSTREQHYKSTTLQLFNSTTQRLNNSTTQQLYNCTTAQLNNSVLRPRAAAEALIDGQIDGQTTACQIHGQTAAWGEAPSKTNNSKRTVPPPPVVASRVVMRLGDVSHSSTIDAVKGGPRKEATLKRESKLPWREAGPANHHDDQVDSDQ